jgi:hypothetical protein
LALQQEPAELVAEPHGAFLVERSLRCEATTEQKTLSWPGPSLVFLIIYLGCQPTDASTMASNPTSSLGFFCCRD